MEILLPKRNDSAQTEKLSSRTVTVVGANGAGKSRFGVEIARRIQDHAFWLSAQKALCIMPPHEVWPGSIEAMYRDAMEHSHYVSREIPTEFDQLLFLLLSEECRNLFDSKREFGSFQSLAAEFGGEGGALLYSRCAVCYAQCRDIGGRS